MGQRASHVCALKLDRFVPPGFSHAPKIIGPSPVLQRQTHPLSLPKTRRGQTRATVATANRQPTYAARVPRTRFDPARFWRVSVKRHVAARSVSPKAITWSVHSRRIDGVPLNRATLNHLDQPRASRCATDAHLLDSMETMDSADNS